MFFSTLFVPTVKNYFDWTPRGSDAMDRTRRYPANSSLRSLHTSEQIIFILVNAGSRTIWHDLKNTVPPMTNAQTVSFIKDMLAKIDPSGNTSDEKIKEALDDAASAGLIFRKNRSDNMDKKDFNYAQYEVTQKTLNLFHKIHIENRNVTRRSY